MWYKVDFMLSRHDGKSLSHFLIPLPELFSDFPPLFFYIFLMRRADFVSVHCPLNDQTRDLIGRPELELMKASAFLINTARGGIVNEDALFDVLEQRRIAGAALDCFVGEPVTSPHRFGTLDNVQLSPHCICWTDEFFRDAGTTAFQSMVSLSFGRPPHGMINPEVLERPGFAKKWERWRGE